MESSMQAFPSKACTRVRVKPDDTRVNCDAATGHLTLVLVVVQHSATYIGCALLFPTHKSLLFLVLRP
jgi:hypothetical protein